VDLPHVIACLNYNAGSVNGTVPTPPTFGAHYNFEQCYLALQAALNAGNCPAANNPPAACSPVALGRSLVVGQTLPPAFDGNCDPNVANSFAKWVSDSKILAHDEASKFALRSAYLTDIYNRASNMSSSIHQLHEALKVFLAPCSGTNCIYGGPAAQLMYARSLGNAVTAPLPNSVIYGWTDALPVYGTHTGCYDQNGHTAGCSHIVKVTAYSAGRGGMGGSWVQSRVPYVHTSYGGFTRTYALRNRDGNVYVSIRRWDEDHSSAVSFPNGHALWQFLFHNPKANMNNIGLGQGLPGACLQATDPADQGAIISGWGLLPQTRVALGIQGNISKSSQNDLGSLQSAFMLNDNGNGQVDNLVQYNKAEYNSCLNQVNQLLSGAPESHACAEYLALDGRAKGYAARSSSGCGNHSYTLKFIPCPNNLPDDLMGQPTGGS
jgi:hypothetical protein